jgi:heat-inducible transcriptional repressor
MTRIFAQPEFNNIEKARDFFEMVDKKDDFTATITKRDDGITITIGGENPGEIMPDSSIVSATYHVGGQYVGKLGVIGPTRMRYSEVTSVIEYMTKNLERSFRVLDEGNSEGEE